MAPPTRDLGTIDLREIIGSSWVDMNEQVPDLLWPLSVEMYSRMRHDPKLTAILTAYSLPIRRATWVLDPAGCRDEVVQTVADDLGLPIQGADTTPGPARRRGVVWAEHLRLALLALVFGHMPFERRYEIRGGQARLVNLGERMPWTLAQIDVTRDGTIESITQKSAGADTIPANRLLWYAHEREGANWVGRSLLRPTFAAWLLKHEIWRVHATSIRRFGMGVPNVEAPPGATPAQVAEAQRLASSIRVGDQSGAGVPHGFKLNLTGLTGSTPDAVEFIRYFDQQMSTAALAGFLDLGQTETGSRALGESFIDLFMLSLQTIADQIAAAATSGQPGLTGAVTDLVDMNWGEDEPAPRVVCTDVGRRHDLAAEAINGLIDSGAITADPDLEAYLRSTYRLPPRAQEDAASGRSYQYDLDYGILTIDERRAQIGLPPLPNGEGTRLPEPSSLRLQEPAPPVPQTGPPAQAGRRRRRNREVRAAGDPAAGHRQLTTIEAASGMDPDAVQGDWDTTLDRLLADWDTLSQEQREQVLEQIRAAVEDGDTEALADLSIDSEAAAAVLAAAMVALAEESAARMVEEAAAQGVEVEQPAVDVERLTAAARVVAAVVAAGLAAAAAREALRVWTPGRSGSEVAGMVGEHLDGLTDSYLREQLGGALSTAQNAGRIAVLADAPEAQYVASEILDSNTCKECSEIDGTAFDTLGEAVEAYASGGYIKCLGRLRCRGIVIAVWGQS